MKKTDVVDICCVHTNDEKTVKLWNWFSPGFGLGLITVEPLFIAGLDLH